MLPLESRVRELLASVCNIRVVFEEDELYIFHTCCGIEKDNSHEGCVTRAMVDTEIMISFSHLNLIDGGKNYYLVYRVKPRDDCEKWS